tara:strand:+ start:663 stop:845 length:183 start_codon:yes stop_codon:yes gene_type:complete
MYNAKQSDHMAEQSQIILNRLMRINDIMLERSSVKDRPNLKQQCEEMRALLGLLKPYLRR